jgi:hypothetical protein
MSSDKDRRQQDRRKEQLALVFYYAQERCEVQTLDLSRGGALIRTPVAFPSGTLLILESFNLCGEAKNVRLLAKVVRATSGATQRIRYSGVGVSWVRAYCSGSEETLRDFLVDSLGFNLETTSAITRSANGDAVFDFPRDAAPPELADPDTVGPYQDKRERLVALQRGRFRMDIPVIYSVHNMHHRGNLVAMGPGGLALSSAGALPFDFSKVTVRYPLDNSASSPRIILYCETELVLEPFRSEPGYFSARILGIDELDNSALFRMHLRTLPGKYPRW